MLKLVVSPLFFQYSVGYLLEHITVAIEDNQMKLQALIEGNKKKYRMQIRTLP